MMLADDREGLTGTTVHIPMRPDMNYKMQKLILP